MAYQRGSLKKAERKEGLTWVLRYRINGKEQTPLVVGMVSDFPTEDDANVEVDRLGLSNCTCTTGGQDQRLRSSALHQAGDQLAGRVVHVVVVLDNRVLTKRYGQAFLEALPECPVEVV